SNIYTRFMKTTLLAKSSSGAPYDVTFSVLEGLMTVHCSCKAGLLQQQCKHKRALVSGDKELLFDQSQTELLKQILATRECQLLVERLAVEESALVSIEREKSRLAAEEKALKRNIGQLFVRGER
ncbi:MAG: hypothetical protein ABL974_19880, partial [Prosthecobacter sp.]